VGRWKGTGALESFADRLEGRAALVNHNLESAVRLLSRASNGFAARGAAWEAACADLYLVEALVASGGAAEASTRLEPARRTLCLLNSVQELEHAENPEEA
jgi:hypothetical protein